MHTLSGVDAIFFQMYFKFCFNRFGDKLIL